MAEDLGSTIENLIERSSCGPRSLSYAVSTDEEEKLRAEYLSIITTRNWLDKMALLLTRSVSSPIPQRQTIRVTLKNETKDVHLPFYIGRQRPPESCTSMDYVQLEEHDGGSRCHVLVTLVADELVLIDPGSLSGVTTLKRSNTDATLDHSRPRKRAVLKFAHTERFVIKVDGIRVGFNLDLPLAGLAVNECVVCMEHPAVERLTQCRHCVVCSLCLDALETCPICREPIPRGSAGRNVTVAAHLHYRPQSDSPVHGP
eukprot:m.480487 g.480487  ORF g.480487 m.480487 type:complete len:258 (-) comp21707_c0_seq32:2682-3455(-)